LIFKYWIDQVEQGFLNYSNELEGCVQTYIYKFERPRKGNFKSVVIL